MTPKTQNFPFFLSAVLARCNYGHGLYDLASDNWIPVRFFAKENKGGNDFTSCLTAVLWVCGNLMESDEHERMFHGEARSFYKAIKNLTPDQTAEMYPTIKPLVEILKTISVPPNTDSRAMEGSL